MAVGILGVLTVSGTTLIYYSSTNARSVSYSSTNSKAYDLAEAGINEMMSILSKPQNNALKTNLLPSTTSTYSDGTVTWSGTLNEATQTWSLTSTGTIANPTGATASNVRRTLTAQVPVTPSFAQPLNNPAWNYVFATRTGDPSGCDLTLNNNVSGGSRLYISGNLCLNNNVSVTSNPLVVKGKLQLNHERGSRRVHEHGHPGRDLRGRLRRPVLQVRKPGLEPLRRRRELQRHRIMSTRSFRTGRPSA